MKAWKILQSLEKFEDCLARFYDALRLRHPDDAVVADFFARMRDEEISHRNIVRYQQRILGESPANYLDLEDYDPGALDQTIRSVVDLVAREAGLTLDEALRCAAVVEKTAAEQRYRTVVSRVNPTLGMLAQKLGCCDDRVARLNAFARGLCEHRHLRTA